MFGIFCQNISDFIIRILIIQKRIQIGIDDIERLNSHQHIIRVITLCSTGEIHGRRPIPGVSRNGNCVNARNLDFLQFVVEAVSVGVNGSIRGREGLLQAVAVVGVAEALAEGAIVEGFGELLPGRVIDGHRGGHTVALIGQNDHGVFSG